MSSFTSDAQAQCEFPHPPLALSSLLRPVLVWAQQCGNAACAHWWKELITESYEIPQPWSGVLLGFYPLVCLFRVMGTWVHVLSSSACCTLNINV